ncbi:MAG: hypothetical protein JZU65_21350 [Chlorobium sp.]|nr:hypothetical protein [Chlorobium sp.]
MQVGNQSYWIVIEGDNGTGKDSLAGQLATIGYDIVTYASKNRAIEKAARTLCGEKRLLAFLSYNQQCGLQAIAKPSLLIRYWISTIAAAYADHLWDWEKAKEKIIMCLTQFPVPYLVIKLDCDLLQRQYRVETRNPDSDDNMCEERDMRYQWALNEIEPYLPAWDNLDTTDLSPLQVYQSAQILLKRRHLI